MRLRPILLIAAAAFVLLVAAVGQPFGNARASVSHQVATNTATAGAATATSTAAAATATSTAAAATATSTAPAATATSTAAAATATSTAAAATATATAATTAVAGTATATPTSGPLAAYPAPVASASVVRAGHSLVFHWSLVNQTGVKGFNLFAAKHKLNTKLIKTHTKLSYTKSVKYHAGKASLHVLFKNGGHLNIPIS